MRVQDWRSDYSVRMYAALLALYPIEFRVRFGQEMLQVFRASFIYEAHCGRTAKLLSFWFRTLKDLLVSVIQEQGRQITRGIHGDNPIVAFVDSLLIPSMIAINLFVLGPCVTALFVGVAAHRISAEQFMTISFVVAITLGTLGVLRALIVARLRPTVRLWVKLS
jgi:hypothetical protein